MSTFIRLTDYKNSDEKEQGFFDPKNRYEAKQEDFEKIPMTPIAFWMNNSTWKLFKENQILNNFSIVKRGPSVPSNQDYIRRWSELNSNSITDNLFNVVDISVDMAKWFLCNKIGGAEKWYAKTEDALLFVKDNNVINISNKSLMLKECIVWSDGRFGSSKFSARFLVHGHTVESTVNFIQTTNIVKTLGYLNSKVAEYFLNITIEGQHFSPIYVKNIPFNDIDISQKNIDLIEQNINISKEEWDSKEASWDFTKNELLKHKQDEQLENALNAYASYWSDQFNTLHANEEELNRLFIDIYGLQDELTPDVDLKDITILKNEAKIIDDELVFQPDEIMKQFISYGVGVMFGRYSLDHKGLHIANMNESLEDANLKFNIQNPTFEADEDNIIPIVDESDYFSDDMTERFIEFVRTTFGSEKLQQNIAFIEAGLGKKLRAYFLKDFYTDHTKRYKKRPIYWLFSSPKGTFKALIYMHRYTPDTLNHILNDYLRPFRIRLDTMRNEALRVTESEDVSARDKTQADKRIDKIDKTLSDINEYEKTLAHYAAQRIEIDLDDGVKVNYCKFQDLLFKFDAKLCK